MSRVDFVRRRWKACKSSPLCNLWIATLDWLGIMNALIDELVKSHIPVTPAKAGVHNILEYVDSRFRGNDRNGAKRTFYERILIHSCPKTVLKFKVPLSPG